MLISLNVKNFAIIDNINIEFGDGLTVLTGETGAGKSLIIDAIGLLFGKRASLEMIRYGEEKATITGLFTNYSEEIISLLDEYDIEYDKEDSLIIKREIYASGKSKCSINNTIVTLAQLQEIGEYVGDIHSQNDSLGLFNPKNYLSFLTTEQTNKELIKYNELLKIYKEKNKAYNDLLKKNEDDTSKSDFLSFQLKELKEASLDIHEEEDLKNELKELNHFETINSAIQDIKDVYSEKDTMNDLYEVLKSLDELQKINPKYEDLYKLFEESYYNIEAVFEDNKLIIKDFDSKRLDDINERLGLYSDLKRKYKKTVQEILDYQAEIEKTLYNIQNYDVLLADLKKESDLAFENVMNVAKELSNHRKIIAHDLTDKVINHLNDLMLKNVQFEIVFQQSDKFLKDGIDEADFLVSFNKGEPAKPLSKIASGGELSRFMLALKTVLGDSLPQQTKIFDEIDSGVSGAVAYSIASKIKQISKNSQVLCITHLPQVASIGDQHLKISKVSLGERTCTVIKELSNEERILEIASMISNGEATDASINLAKEMLQ